MANYNLTLQDISASFQQLLQKNDDTGYLVNGTGSIVDGLTVSGTISGSFVGDGSGVTNVSAVSAQTASLLEGNAEQVSHIDMLAVSEPIAERRIIWNEDDGTFNLGLKNDVVLQAGQEQHYYGKATEVIPNGSVVQFAGAQGNFLLFKRAVQAEIAVNPEYVIGIATQTFSNNQFGYVTSFGKVRGVTTTGLGVGTILWYDSEGSTPGTWTTTEPSNGYEKIQLAAITDEGPNGTIFVRTTHIRNMDEIGDVSITSITNGDALIYNSSEGLWKNTQTVPSASYAVTASHALNAGASAWDDITGKPSGLVSSSDQLTSSYDSRYATTGSNAFVGDQVILPGANLIVVSGRVAGPQGDFTNINQYTASNDLFVTQLLNASTSFEEKFEVIGTQSGSWSGGGIIDTGSFATTGSNTFVGDQLLTGSAQLQYKTLDSSLNTVTFVQGIDGSGNLILSASNPGNYENVIYSIDKDNGRISYFGGNEGPGTGVTYYARVDVNGQFFTTTVNASSMFADNIYYNSGPTGTIKVWNSVALYSPDIITNLAVSGALDVSGSLKAALQEGYVWVGGADGYSTTVSTGSFGGGGSAFPYTGDAQITGSLGVSNTVTSQIFINPQTLTGTQTVPTGYNGMLTGPVSNAGTIVIEPGANLVII